MHGEYINFQQEVNQTWFSGPVFTFKKRHLPNHYQNNFSYQFYEIGQDEVDFGIIDSFKICKIIGKGVLTFCLT